MVCTYTTRFPHVNCDSVPPSHTEVIPWHSPADEVIADVWCDQNAWRDRDSHALSFIIVDGPRGFDTPSDVRVLLFRDGNDVDLGYKDDWSFFSGKQTNADEDAVDVAVRCFSAATGGSLGPIAVEHMRDESFWCLQRWGGVHQYDNHSYLVWFPSHLTPSTTWAMMTSPQKFGGTVYIYVTTPLTRAPPTASACL
jgi:hypothetical protein